MTAHAALTYTLERNERRQSQRGRRRHGHRVRRHRHEPAYTLQECLGRPHGVAPVPANVLGCVSLIVWSLLFVVTIKYVGRADAGGNRGEGGIVALLALVPRQLRERAPGVLGTTTVLVLIGAALLFGDGIITPAISVLSAVEGLRVVTPALEPVIVPATVVILAGLFSIQGRGSGGLGRYFGPVMAPLARNRAGARDRSRDRGGQRCSPRFRRITASSSSLRERFAAFRALGGVVLSVTGGEALYADMGHFGRRPIRIGWLTFALPALIVELSWARRGDARRPRCGASTVLRDGPEPVRPAFHSCSSAPRRRSSRRRR